jgi:hypothetical protein
MMGGRYFLENGGCGYHRLWPGLWLSATPSTIEYSRRMIEKAREPYGKL